MAKNPDIWFPLYVKEWVISTRNLSPEAKGCYIDLLAYAWDHGHLPTDLDECRTIAGAAPQQWARVWPKLSSRWVERNGALYNERQEAERAKAASHAERGKKGGKLSVGSRKALYGTAQPEANVEANPEANPEANVEATPKAAPNKTQTQPQTQSSDDDREPLSLTAGQLRHAAIDLLDLWRQHGTGAPTPAIEKLADKERRYLWKSLNIRSLDEWEAVFKRAKASDYLSGRDGQYPPMSLSRVLACATAIESGDHDNRGTRAAAAGTLPLPQDRTITPELIAQLYPRKEPA